MAELEALALPVGERALDDVHESALAAALDRFDGASFGAAGSAELEVRRRGRGVSGLKEAGHVHPRH